MKERSGSPSASWDVFQQPEPKIARLRDGSGSLDAALTIKTKSLKLRGSLSLQSPNWELVPQERGLEAEGSASGWTVENERCLI